MIYSSEAWPRISDTEVTRLEQADLALLRRLVEAHSKCSKAFILLKFEVIWISYLIMIRRIMYHHQIIGRDNDEIIKKIYFNQTTVSLQKALISKRKQPSKHTASETQSYSQ